ncbi:DUF2065 domain-containing protein [Veronia nyctiphanis]|uniref:DUF2065 domain-containing protein n=1 Tax=Veronia nyctiphanis TaxID=1278244 RepID=A0A4Q0YW29_9GAMM|nr:DUF2065 domain-containing protein [Veronia nyctiphanis]RXJ73389.1 DUF2065 domain-containing protein [Veronia nyctiphanis]
MIVELWLAIGIALMLEGLGPLLFPEKWRKMMSELSSQPSNLLRRIGGCLVAAGFAIAYMMWSSK